MLISASTEDINMLIVGIEYDRLMRSKIISVFTDGFPSVKVTALCCLNGIRVTAFALVLLILSLKFLLINPYNIKTHPTHLSASVLKPGDTLEAVDVEAVLLRVAFE